MDTKKTCEKCVKCNECFKSINFARYVPAVQNCIDNGRCYFLPKEAPKFQFANGDKKTANEIFEELLKKDDLRLLISAVRFFIFLGYVIRFETKGRRGAYAVVEIAKDLGADLQAVVLYATCGDSVKISVK